ncbi:MAG TPA: APC family permease [Streptosporangiaceae bacterium]
MSSQLHGPAAGQPADASQNTERLERHAIGLPAVTAQSAALIGPAAGSVAGLAFIVGYSGAATPLAFLIGLVVCVCVALVIGEYAKRLPSAGSFYTYLTRTFGPKTGFVTGVMLFGAYLLLFPFQLDFFGNFVSSLLAASDVHITWIVFAVLLIVVSTTLGVLGVKPSLRTGLIALGIEMAILTVFALVIIFQGGASGNTLEVFNPASSLKGSSGLLTAVVYTIFAFVGFESATTLGDEAREPRRTIPRAVMLTTVVVGIFFVVVSYAVTIGYGLSPKHVNALATAATPFNTLADHYGNGVLSVFVNLAVISSFSALNIVTVIAVSRILWKMGRDRLLPEVFGRVNRRQSPHVACLVAGGLALVASVGFGQAYGPLAFASWLSYFATLFFIAAYLLISGGLIRFIWRDYRSEFSWLRHGALPVISIAAMVWVLYGNIHPYPPAPLRWFIYATIGVIIVSIGIAHWIERRRPDAMLRAGQLLADIEVEEETALARPGRYGTGEVGA